MRQDPMIGIGGAPTRATTLPDDGAERKKYPLASGLFDYFPDALVAVSNVSWQGNNQHNPGQPLHWARGKSSDEADTMLRHFSARGTIDTDGIRHSAKMVWRALAILQKEIEASQAEQPQATESTVFDELKRINEIERSKRLQRELTLPGERPNPVPMPQYDWDAPGPGNARQMAEDRLTKYGCVHPVRCPSPQTCASAGTCCEARSVR